MKTIKDAIQASSIEQRRRILNNLGIDKDSKNFIVSGKANQANGGDSDSNMLYYKVESLMEIDEGVGPIVHSMIDDICYIYPNTSPYEIVYIGSPIFLIEHNNLSFVRGFGIDFSKKRVLNGIICHNLEEYIRAFFKGENGSQDELKFIVEQIHNLPTITKEEYFNLVK